MPRVAVASQTLRMKPRRGMAFPGGIGLFLIKLESKSALSFPSIRSYRANLASCTVANNKAKQTGMQAAAQAGSEESSGFPKSGAIAVPPHLPPGT
jgi:hypothetical protein